MNHPSFSRFCLMVLLLLTASLVLLPTRPAGAWCLFSGAELYPTFWKFEFKDSRVDVYISLGPDTSFLQTGLSLVQAEALVRRILAVHNETVGPPYLVYAGTTDEDQVINRPPGLVISAHPCDQDPCGDASVAACASITGSAEPGLRSKVWVVFRPSRQLCPDSGEDWSVNSIFGLDLANYLLHEIGHPLGLDHSDKDEAECGGLWAGPAGAAVMHHIISFPNPARRDWRRDDIEGLRQIWGSEIEHSVYSWQDGAFPDSPAEDGRTAVCAEVRTPPALTTAVSDTAIVDAQFIAFTDATDRVVHLQWDGTGFAAPAVGAVVDPSAFGISFAPVAIAHSDAGERGPRRVLVLWTAEETLTEFAVRLRWALRDIDGGPWSYGFLDPPGLSQSTKDVAIGFDRGNSFFLVSGITNAMNPYFMTVDLQGNSLGTLVLGELNDPPFVFDIGAASCFPDGGASRCVVPYISSELDAMIPDDRILRSGWYNLEVLPGGTMALVQDSRVSDFEP